MFDKVLIANRGEIAVRIIRTCRDMGIKTVALYEAHDRGSLHVRLADECVELKSSRGYLDGEAVLKVALDVGANAIHPGYGFLAERLDFIAACEDAGIVFIGPPLAVMHSLHDKIDVLNRVRANGYATTNHSFVSFGENDLEALRAEAHRMGYPIVIKSCQGGRGRGLKLAVTPDQLAVAVRRAQAEAQIIYGDRRVYVERLIEPSHLIAVQIVGDAAGHIIHLGEREGSLQRGNQKFIEESPAPCLFQAQREQVWQQAIEIARLFNYQSVGTVEFIVDGSGQFFFTEIKPRIQIEHPVTEMVSSIDLVREQIRVAAAEPLSITRAAVQLRGHAISCRISAEDPLNNFLPTPGHLRRVRLPGGPHVRVDTYVYSGCDVPAEYDPIVAKVCVWGEDRDECVLRLRRALEDFALIGTPTNLPVHLRILSDPDFVNGDYTTDFFQHLPFDQPPANAPLRDLAIAAAIAYVRRNLVFQPSLPDRLRTGWHRSSRHLPGV